MNKEKWEIIFDQFTFESTLKKVSGTLVAFGVPVGVAAQQILHALGQIGLRRAEEKVNMIGHPDEAEDVPSGPIDGFFQTIGHPLIVSIFVKQKLSPVTTSHDMVDRAGKLNSKRTCHEMNVVEKNAAVDRKQGLRKRRDKPAWS